MSKSKSVATIRDRIAKMTGEFQRVLPPHITGDKFARVVLTALQRSPDLRAADEASLFEACMLCAQDGLLPDGREAALVVYSTRVRLSSGDHWIKKVQYIPMIAGLRKKALQSGAVKEWIARVVRQNDKFRVVYGDRDSIVHEPAIVEPGEMVAAYSRATLPDGSVSYEVMLAEEIWAVRASIKRRDTGRDVWDDYPGEMARKTVMRRHAKSLLLPAELAAAVERIDQIYQADETTRDQPIPPAVRGSLDEFASSVLPAPEGIDAGPDFMPSSDDEPDWEQLGMEACHKGVKYTAPPVELRSPDKREALESWQRGWRNGLESGKGIQR